MVDLGRMEHGRKDGEMEEGMIWIQNIDPNPRRTGLHRYALRINRDLVCEFEHDREDSLECCLLAAADAAHRAATRVGTARAGEESCRTG